EDAEPLLSRQLYDTLRKFTQDNATDVKEVRDKLSNNGLLSQNLDEQLERTSVPDGAKLADITSEMLRMDFLPPAHETAERTRANLEDLKRGVEHAAESVLGDDTEALRQARDQLNQLTEQLEREISQAQGGGTNQQANAAGSQQPGNENQSAGERSAQAEGQQDSGTQPGNSQQARAGQRGQRSGQPNDSNSSEQSQSGQNQQAASDQNGQSQS